MPHPGLRRRTGSTTLRIDPLTLAGGFLAISADDPGLSALNDADALTTTADFSGNARTATTITAGFTGRPRYKKGANGSPTGLPLIEFPGGDPPASAQMRGTLPADPGIANTTGYTIYVWFNQLALTTSGFNFQTAFSTTSPHELQTDWVGNANDGTADGKICVLTRSFGDAVLGKQLITIQVPAAGGIPSMYRNGVLLTGTTTPAVIGPLIDNYYLGSSPNGNGGCNFRLGCWHGFQGVHNTTTRAAVEAFLINKWG